MNDNKLVELQELVFETFCEKGFNDLPIEEDFIQKNQMLIITEICEAYESHRKGERFTYFEDDKPEGEGYELADAVIRILNFDKQLQTFDSEGCLDLDRVNNTREVVMRTISRNGYPSDNFPTRYGESYRDDSINRMYHFMVARSIDGLNNLKAFIFEVDRYCKFKGYDLEEMIRVKNEYNRKGERLHGKRF